MCRLKLCPEDELTVDSLEMDALLCQNYPYSTEFYRAQAELARQRARFQSRLYGKHALH